MAILFERIRQAKYDPSEMVSIIATFDPLLKKYARSLGYEDGYADLQVDFIELLRKFNIDTFCPTDDYAVLSYIKKAVCMSYIKRSSANYTYHKFNNFMSSLSESEQFYVEQSTASCDGYLGLTLADLKNILTEKEFIVVWRIICFDESGEKIATKLGISRQAVWQLKSNALKKLRKIF